MNQRNVNSFFKKTSSDTFAAGANRVEQSSSILHQYKACSRPNNGEPINLFFLIPKCFLKRCNNFDLMRLMLLLESKLFNSRAHARFEIWEFKFNCERYITVIIISKLIFQFLAAFETIHFERFEFWTKVAIWRKLFFLDLPQTEATTIFPIDGCAAAAAECVWPLRRKKLPVVKWK